VCVARSIGETSGDVAGDQVHARYGRAIAVVILTIRIANANGDANVGATVRQPPRPSDGRAVAAALDLHGHEQWAAWSNRCSRR
jgi:hypothetical protein